MFEEVLDGLQPHGVEVFGLLPLGVDRQDLVDGHGQQLVVAAGLVVHFEHADRATGHHHARNERHGRDHQHVHRVSVICQGLGDVAVVAGIVHRRAHETVHEQGAGFLIHLVLDGVGIHRDFDDDVELFRGLGAGRNVVQAHTRFQSGAGQVARAPWRHESGLTRILGGALSKP